MTAPPIRRTPLSPRDWPPPSLGARRRGRARPSWQHAARLRRLTLILLVLVQSTLGAWAMSAVLPYKGARPIEIALIALFVPLFAWVSAGFWTAMMGFWVHLRGGDALSICRTLRGPRRPIAPAARTALVMPICNESVSRVAAGLRATCESLLATGDAERFEVFLLSDSSDPGVLAEERLAWAALAAEFGGKLPVWYRHRRHRIKKKSGNIADFCRRWGRLYRYMIVLDADSVMSGECLATLVRLMEANPTAGIIQGALAASGRATLYARIQQFAQKLYTPLFMAGMHYWQLGESHYWGHNAIIRLAPFMQHCILGRIRRRGRPSEILSHDFVEAALMRRAGWGVWLAWDLPGSYEEMPPNLLDELGRDRRWCEGNLINARFFVAQGIHPVHRAVFATGVMAYLSAPLWFLFLGLSTAFIAINALVPPTYFFRPEQLFPVWPHWSFGWAMGLLAATAAQLFLPKFLALALALRDAPRHGGAARLAASVLAESIVSALLAPVRMLFHTRFVIGALSGWKASWRSPAREDAETGWVDATRRHGLATLLGLGWAGFVLWVDPPALAWLAPVVGALVLSIPLSVLLSRRWAGLAARRGGLFLIPEEKTPPPVLARLAGLLYTERVPGESSRGSQEPTLPPKAQSPMTAQANELEHGNSRFWRAALRRS